MSRMHWHWIFQGKAACAARPQNPSRTLRECSGKGRISKAAKAAFTLLCRLLFRHQQVFHVCGNA